MSCNMSCFFSVHQQDGKHVFIMLFKVTSHNSDWQKYTILSKLKENQQGSIYSFYGELTPAKSRNRKNVLSVLLY